MRRGEPASGRGKVMRGGRPSSPPAWRAAAALKRGGAPRPQRKVPTSLRRTATSGLRGRRRRGGRPRGEVAERDGDGGRSREMGRARRGGEVREGRADSGGRRRREGKAARKAARLAVGGGGVAIWVRGRVRPRRGDKKNEI